MTIFIDLDDVLFDTAAFTIELKNVFASCGIGEDLFHATYIKAREHDEGAQVYSYAHHLAILDKEHDYDSTKINAAVEHLLEHTKAFVFDDVESVLVTLRDQGHKICLVSFGSSSIQNGKVCGSGLEKYFDEMIIGEINKGESIKTFLDGGKGDDCVFLEDRTEHISSVKRVCPKITTMLVRRPEGRYHDEKTSLCDFTVGSMSEAGEIINELSANPNP